MDESMLIAHVRKNDDGTWDQPQPLDEHLKRCAAIASKFASSFNSSDWGYIIGLAHDIGKSSPEWQHYLATKSGYDEEACLETRPGKKDHSTPSAKVVEQALGKGIGRLLAYCIAGHHSGLPDGIGTQGSLASRLQNAAISDIPQKYHDIFSNFRPSAPPWNFDSKGLDLSLWIRMLFSCLVDADFLDTEAYMEPQKSGSRSGYASLAELLDRFNTYMAQMVHDTIHKSNIKVHQARQRVLADCRAASMLDPGFFSLTVPTGGGKTLSSMAFALEHAVRHGKERIIYVIPYTSIIEQNADVFRNVFGREHIIEHHSNLSEEDASEKALLASENWDAPIIITTTVQFFESLFAAKPSRCRKLHNIANSVIIFDEAQLIPTEYLEPILAALRLLCEHYKATIVFCTATQPAFEASDTFPGFPGLPRGSIREIIHDVPGLYRDLERVHIEPIDTRTTRSWQEIADELKSYEKVLCVVSDRKSCRLLHSLMPEGTYHLSALMCAQHRSDCISEIKQKLKKSDEPVRVISTQLVEAGVDIDFPVVYRALAGLDSIAQSAGRCNREGRLNENAGLGKVVVFAAEKKPPVGILRKACETTERLLDSGKIKDPLDHEAFRAFFSELYWKANSLDAKDIIKLLSLDTDDGSIQFRSAADAFRIIDDSNQKSILVPYDEGEELIRILKAKGPERWLMRRLQRYSINIYTNDFFSLLNRGSIEEVSTGIFALSCSIEYDDTVGLLINEMPHEPEAFIVI